MDTAFIIGNGESRYLFPIKNFKNKGIIYGCNAIYRDFIPDFIFSGDKKMSLDMYEAEV